MVVYGKTDFSESLRLPEVRRHLGRRVVRDV